jgi:hypothetical protein
MDRRFNHPTSGGTGQQRSRYLACAFGYKSSTVRDAPLSVHPVDLSDLLSADLLTVGQTLVPQALNLRQHTAKILSDGRIDIDGQIFDTPSGAGHRLRRKATNG